jgi:CHAT domain-containing protein
MSFHAAVEPKVFKIVFLALMCILILPVGYATSEQNDLLIDSDYETEIKNLLKQGLEYVQAGNYDDASKRFEDALKQARSHSNDSLIGASLLGLGDIAEQNRMDYAKALELYDLATIHFDRANDWLGQVYALRGVSLAHSKVGDQAKALNDLRKASAILKKIVAGPHGQDTEGIIFLKSSIHMRMAELLKKQALFPDALDAFKIAADGYMQLDQFHLAGLTKLEIADTLLFNLGRSAEAIPWYNEAASALRKAGKDADAMASNYGLGMAYLSTSNYDKAVDLFIELADFSEKEKNPQLLAHADYGLCRCADAFNDMRTAANWCEEALKVIRDNNISNNLFVAEVAYMTGKVLKTFSLYEKATEHFHTAALNYKEANSPVNEADALKEIADIHRWLGDYKLAVRYYTTARDIYEKNRNAGKGIEILVSLAGAEIGRSTPTEEAIEHFRQDSIRLLRSMEKGLEVDPSSILDQIKKIWIPEEESKKILFQVRADLEAKYLEDRLVPTAMLFTELRSNFLRAQYWRMKLPSLDESYITAAGKIYQTLADFSIRKGDFPGGGVYAYKASLFHGLLPRDRDAHSEYAKDLFLLAIVELGIGNWEKALDRLYMALALGYMLQSSEIHLVYGALGVTYYRLGQQEKALDAFRRGLNLFETVWKYQEMDETRIALLELGSQFYQHYVDVLLNVFSKTGISDYRTEAFEVCERLRARGFLQMLELSNKKKRGGQIALLSSDREDFRRRLDTSHSRLRKIEVGAPEERQLLQEMGKIRDSISELDTKLRDRSEKPSEDNLDPISSITEIQALIEKDTAVLEYSVGLLQTILWVITKETFHYYIIPSLVPLQGVQEYLKSLREPLVTKDEISKHIELGQKCYRWLFEPAASEFKNTKRLIVIPDGLLHYLPFETLIMPDLAKEGRSRISPLTIPYLFKEYEITYVPSAAIFVMQNRVGIARTQARLPILAFGDPAYEKGISQDVTSIKPTQQTNAIIRDSNLTRLAFSGEEVRGIAGIWGIPIPSEHINLGKQANVNRLRELDISRYRIIHMACHGILADQVKWATQPALVLSPVSETESSSLLQLSDILDLKLNADLVVLSACSTGLGQLKDGEGIIGLTRGFMSAGASSVLVSLWEVEDQSTCLLMQRFHSYLKEGKPKGEALRKAKLDLLNSEIFSEALGTRERLASPYYWAPFILVGDSH